MSKFQQRAEAQTKQLIGQMLPNELLVQEGKKQQREATEPNRPPVAMTRASSVTNADRSSPPTRSAPSA